MAYDNNAQQVPLSQAMPGMPSNEPQEDPLLANASAVMKAQNDAVTMAAKTLQSTPAYTSTHQNAPQMPVPKPAIFGGASVNNLANKQPETRAGARSKGIGMIAGQAAHLVGTYFKKKEAEKTQALAIDLNKSLELNNGLDEAKAIMEQYKDQPNSPEYKEAQAVTQKNNMLLTSLLNGKSGKDIAKAYGVTFGPEAQEMSPEKKKDSMHHNAMQQALTQFKNDIGKMFHHGPQTQSQPNQNPGGQTPTGGMTLPNQPGFGPAGSPPAAGNPPAQSRADQFRAQQAARITINPAYTAAMEQYKTMAKTADETQKTVLGSLDKRYTADAGVTKEEIAANERWQATVATNLNNYNRTLATADATVKAAGIRAQGAVSAASAGVDGRAQVMYAANAAKMYHDLSMQDIDISNNLTKVGTDIENAKKLKVKETDPAYQQLLTTQTQLKAAQAALKPAMQRAEVEAQGQMGGVNQLLQGLPAFNAPGKK
jgi:hypothetical protein